MSNLKYPMRSFARLQLIKAIANLRKLITVYGTKADSAKAGKSAKKNGIAMAKPAELILVPMTTTVTFWNYFILG